MLFNKPVTRQNKLTEMNRVDDDKGGGDRRGGKERKKERKTGENMVTTNGQAQRISGVTWSLFGWLKRVRNGLDCLIN